MLMRGSKLGVASSGHTCCSAAGSELRSTSPAPPRKPNTCNTSFILDVSRVFPAAAVLPCTSQEVPYRRKYDSLIASLASACCKCPQTEEKSPFCTHPTRVGLDMPARPVHAKHGMWEARLYRALQRCAYDGAITRFAAQPDASCNGLGHTEAKPRSSAAVHAHRHTAAGPAIRLAWAATPPPTVSNWPKSFSVL